VTLNQENKNGNREHTQIDFGEALTWGHSE